jgi:NADPH2:quinone reductase
MHCILISTHGPPSVLVPTQLPVPRPKPHEALVALKAIGVNFIDVYFREGRYPTTLPFVPGQEGAGVVTALGADVKQLAAGDRVAYTASQGSYAEFAAVPASGLVKLPERVDFRQGAAAMLQGMTAHYLTHACFPLAGGDTALVHAAAGGVGLLLVQLAKHLGARVIATAGSEAKAELARAAGADETIRYREQDFEAETKRLTDGRGVDVVYDGVAKDTFEKDLNVLRPRGMLVLFGGASGAVPPLDPMRLSQKGSLVLTRPTLAHFIATRAELEHRAGAVLGMVERGELRLRIAHEYPLAAAADAHRDLEARTTAGKLLLIPETAA